MAIRRGFATVFTGTTLVMVIVAALAFIVARLLHQHLIGRIDALARVPEVSDLIIMLLAGGFLRGYVATSAVIGAGLSLLQNLGKRLNIAAIV